jgi:hypothetical protein
MSVDELMEEFGVTQSRLSQFCICGAQRAIASRLNADIVRQQHAWRCEMAISIQQEAEMRAKQLHPPGTFVRFVADTPKQRGSSPTGANRHSAILKSGR